ncbi:MAG: S8 family serine peptidase, partial [Acidothermaceae bacterium]
MKEAMDGTGGGRRGGAPVPGATWARNRNRIGRLAAGTTACAAAVGMLAAPGIANASAPAAAGVSASSSSAVISSTGAYIVQATAGQVAQAKADAIALGGRIGVDLPIINGFGVTLPGSALAALAGSSDVREVSPDATGSVQGSSYYPYTDAGSTVGLSSDIGYNAYWNQGLSGQGVGVALIDSGIAPVPALAASGKVFYGPDFTPTGYFSAVRGLDTFGHGTFMAGLIAGRDPGATAPYYANSGYFLGAAPDAHIVSVKVADASGETTESAVIAAIQWVVQHRNDSGLNIKVLNLSLGIRDNMPYTHDPLDAAAEAAWKSGITVVAAAGNDGKHGMTAPANDPYVIAVGAVDTGSTISVSDDLVASFSNVGDGVRNPDFGTLGTHIVSLRVPGSAIDRQYASGSAVSPSLMRGSGTSEAAAITSGSAALLIGQRPGITPDQVKATMAVHSMWLPNLSGNNLGAGELNMAWTLNAATEYRTQSWPSASGAPGAISSVQSAQASTTPSGATWTGATWTARSWAGATWTGATWTGATWTGATWTGATWTGATWTGATWT